MDPFENESPGRFTELLRDKFRKDRGLPSMKNVSEKDQQKQLIKRNLEVKKSYSHLKEGLVLDYLAFEPEAYLIKRMRLSKDKNLQVDYMQFSTSVDRLKKPDKLLTKDLILGRCLKYGLYKLKVIESLESEQLESDYLAFKANMDLTFKKKQDEDTFLAQCKIIKTKSEKIKTTQLQLDFLEQQGFSFNEKTFDDIFTKGWENIQDDSESSEEEFPQNGAFENDIEEHKVGEVHRESDDDFDSDDSDAEIPEESSSEEEPESEEEEIDIENMENPAAFNWFMYLVHKHLNENKDSILQSKDESSYLLQRLRSKDDNDGVMNDILERMGFDVFETVAALVAKRDFIKEYCEVREKQLKSASNESYKPRINETHSSLSTTIQVVQGSYQKGGKNKKPQQDKMKPQVSQMQNVQQTQLDLLKAMGFDESWIDEAGRAGLKPKPRVYRGENEQKLKEDMRSGANKGTRDDLAQIYKNKGGIEAGKGITVAEAEDDYYKFIQLTPPPKDNSSKKNLIPISKLPPYARGAFSTTEHLNTIQSIVYNAAFETSQNVLVAAPTGAGKTNIALLTIMREIHLLMDKNDTKGPWSCKEKKFKIVYIAPLKALAAEIVEKFEQALGYLDVKVHELTGDIGLTKAEISDTHILVATPEKWDVVTRKTDGQMDEVNCMIIDEIHLLNDTRGAVLECLVARAMACGQRLQKQIRIVGLSATLPNFLDVADFIGATKTGTFAFDSSYRPTPLKCGFYGIKERGNTDLVNNVMNDVIFENLIRILKMENARGERRKQMIIFVHKRAQTFSTAQEMIELLRTKRDFEYLFDCEDSHKVKQKVLRSRNNQVKEIFDYGFGIHHAGMLRPDRKLSEALFRDGHIKVLVSTSTLAWGVNLPAYCVMIKGTKVYNMSAGIFQDVGVFDVQQIFGRAGRPQYDTEGEAIIMTEHKQVDNYVKMMSNSQEIESHLMEGLSEALNAEIASGMITTVTEGIQWLKKSYFYRRVLKNPLVYGFTYAQLQDDRGGHMLMYKIILERVQNLNRMRLIRYNANGETVNSTDMGRVASNYYINCETMGYFMANCLPNLTEERIMYHMAHATEFKQLDARKEEMEELKYLIGESTLFEIDKNSYNESYAKVMILFECYLKSRSLKTFSLFSDMTYIVQNGARLLRAMFEIALRNGYADLAKLTLEWCQILEKRVLPHTHPLRQFSRDCSVGKLTNPNEKVTNYGYIHDEIYLRLEQQKISLYNLLENNYQLRGNMAPAHKTEMHKFANTLPFIDIDVQMQPITRSILKISLTIYAEWNWNDRWNGKSEPFWIVIDNGSEILHQEYLNLTKKDVIPPGASRNHTMKNQELVLTFFIPYQVPEGELHISESAIYHLGIWSDRWYNLDYSTHLRLADIAVPDEDYPHTKLLPLRPMPIKSLGNPHFEELYRHKFEFFNPIQTQVFHTLFHTDSNALIGAPTGSGKTIMSELAILRVFANTPNKKVIYIAPLKALAKERIIDWKIRLGSQNLKKSVLELTGDNTPDIKALQEADLLITTPEKWDGISRNWQHRSYVSDVALVIIDEIHLLGQDRGPVIEVIVSRMRYIAEQTDSNVRFVGLSTALANAKDVADWMGIHKLGLFNFKPSVRPVPIKVFFDGFSEKHYCPRMATMNRPCYKAIQTHSKDAPVLVFVSSRRQTRLTALDLIAMSASEASEQDLYDGFKKPFLHMDHEEISALAEFVKDESLKQTIQWGIGMHHAGLEESDRKLVEDLFVKKKIQVLVTTSTLAWGVNFPARLVVVKGTEFFDPNLKRYVDFPLTDLLQMIGRAGRPGFDDSGTACVFVTQEKKNFYKKFLYEPFPVESSLATCLTDHLNAEIASGTLHSRQNCIDYLTWTYFFRRLAKNPAYYKVEGNNANSINDYLNNLVNENLGKLRDSGCVELSSESDEITPTQLGHLASFYYVSHETVAHLQNTIHGSSNIAQLIDVLSKCQEFKGLPVRHNEEILNESLTHVVPIPVNRHTLDSPHTKTNLLLQAHFERCPLPITDFITDSKSVLDQSIRILQCMVDICAHKGHLQSTINCIHILQMLIQGHWLDQSPFLNIPYFTENIINKLAKRGIMHLIQIVSLKPDTLRKIFKEINSGLEDSEVAEIIHILNRVPVCKVRWSVVATEEDGTPLKDTPLEEGGEAKLIINIERTNKAYSQGVGISNFAKYKEAAWFVLVINKVTNEIIVVKRISFKRRTSKELAIALPDDFEEETFDVYLMCDSYIGLDQVINVNFANANEAIYAAKEGRPVEEKTIASNPVVHVEPEKEVQTQIDSEEEDGQYSLFGAGPASKKNENYETYEIMQNHYCTKLDEDELSDDSFEFDVNVVDDIYDLTNF